MRCLTSLGLTLAILCGTAEAQHAPPLPEGVTASRVDFHKIPFARTPRENRGTWEVRRDSVLWAVALEKLPAEFSRPGGGSRLPTIALARFEVDHEVEATNRYILDPKVRVYAKNGTDFHDLGKACAREGDYDFTLRGWMPVLFRFWNQPNKLWPETRRKILHELSPERGNKIQNWRTFCGVPIHETENHILMTETSQLLTNELLNRERAERGLPALAAYDNDANGMNRWAREHLARFLSTEFEEFNSRPYQPYAVMPIWNIAEFAQDAALRQIARSLLDYLGAKYVASSQKLRRLPPFRRQAHTRENWEMMERDGDSGRMLALTGAAAGLESWKHPMQWSFDLHFALYALIGDYRLPSLLESRFFSAEETSLQRFHHFVPEIYARFPGGLISGGGVYRKGIPPFKTDIDAVAMPTTLIPEGKALDGHELIRIEGHQKESSRSNLCVAPGFACGTNVVIPDSIPENCRTTVGDWTFLNLATPSCPVDHRLWVAVFKRPCDSRKCRKEGSNYGFFEAVRPQGDFDSFRARILARAQTVAFRSEGTQTWTTDLGHRVKFTPVTGSKGRAGISEVDFAPIDPEWEHWSLAEGDVIEADGRGRMELRPGAGHLPILIDVTDPHHPFRAGD